jgi:hypothetical protein
VSRLTTQDFLLTRFCQIDDPMATVPKRPDAKRDPSEVVPLARLFPNLLTHSLITPSSSGVAGAPHEGHFYPALAQQSAAYDLNKSLVTYLSTFPLGSSRRFHYAIDWPGIPAAVLQLGPVREGLTIGKGVSPPG